MQLFIWSALIAGCDHDSVLGGVERPDLGYALLEASDAAETGGEPKLVHEQCEKQAPIVQPIQQKWFCRFSFEATGEIKDCSAILSVQADDHWGIWKPEIRLNPSNGQIESTLVCKVRLRGS